MKRSLLPRLRRQFLAAVITLGSYGTVYQSSAQSQAEKDAPYLIVLGISQDAGTPQSGSHDHPGWENPEKRFLATSLGLVDPSTGKSWMFEATPDFREQWYTLDKAARASFLAFSGTASSGTVSSVASGSASSNTDSASRRPQPDGIFLTHAHIGHYTGLMFLGRESMSASNLKVYAMEDMADFLSINGPWDQLIALNNIQIRQVRSSVPVELTPDIHVVPIVVPHRQEYSEVVGYRIVGPSRTVLFIPDIDSWTDWDLMGTRLEAVLETVDVAYLDGSFFANGEIPGRDMSGFPHPFITTTMDRLAPLPSDQRDKIRFIHLNHTNPASNPDSEQAALIRENGFRVAAPKERIVL